MAKVTPKFLPGVPRNETPVDYSKMTDDEIREHRRRREYIIERVTRGLEEYYAMKDDEEEGEQ
jgi:hypothetical protein